MVKKRNIIGAVIGGTVGAGAVLVGLPVCIGALGFTGAGSAVAVLQSIGAAGLSLGAKVGLTSALGSAGAASGAWLSKQKKPPSDKPKKG
nr:interferon alpha-inducible protein 27-like protein 1 [Taeniopygia guttata]